MAVISSRYGQKRPQYAQRVYYVRVLNGSLRASAWPHGRGGRPSPQQQRVQDAFKARLWWVKHMHMREIEPLRLALLEWLKTNRGLRGSAAIRLRDLLLQIVAGRLFGFVLPTGQQIYTWQVHRDATMLLDWLEPQKGSLLGRTETAWKPTVPCKTGAVLTMAPESQTSNCCEPNRIALRGELP